MMPEKTLFEQYCQDPKFQARWILLCHEEDGTGDMEDG